jgi:hypothetical protein
MTELESREAAVADLASVIERLAGDLWIGEEPARFFAALEGERGEDQA